MTSNSQSLAGFTDNDAKHTLRALHRKGTGTYMELHGALNNMESAFDKFKHDTSATAEQMLNDIVNGVDNTLTAVDWLVFGAFLFVGMTMVFRGHKLKRMVLFAIGAVGAMCLFFLARDTLPGFLARHQRPVEVNLFSIMIEFPAIPLSPRWPEENKSMMQILFALLGVAFGFILIQFQKFGLAALGASVGCLLSTLVNKYATPKMLNAFDATEYHFLATIGVFVVLACVSAYTMVKCFGHMYALTIPVVGAFIATNAVGVFARCYGPPNIFRGLELPMDPFTKASTLDDIKRNWESYIDETERNMQSKQKLEEMINGCRNGYVILLAVFALCCFIGVTLQFKEKKKQEKEKGKITMRKTYGSVEV